jgi:hypothetical protein
MDPWVAILISTWLSFDTDVKHIHTGYDLDLKTESLMLLHNFLIAYLLFGLFFVDPVIHLVVAFTVFASRVALGDCLLSVWQKDWINYSDSDLRRIHGDTEQEEQKLYIMTGLLMLVDLWKIHSRRTI